MPSAGRGLRIPRVTSSFSTSQGLTLCTSLGVSSTGSAAAGARHVAIGEEPCDGERDTRERASASPFRSDHTWYAEYHMMRERAGEELPS